jgi:hypothetical protein
MIGCGHVLLVAALLVGCAPTYHRPPAYRYDRPRSAALEEHAEEVCRSLPGNATLPDRRFVTDGCTLWFDGLWTGRSWQSCCVDHDLAYWCGGDSTRREIADQELASCVAAEYSPWMGSVMRLGTRTLSGRYIPAHWRWGYGHEFGGGYSNASEAGTDPPD